MALAIDVRGLKKTYRTRAGSEIQAVRGIDLAVEEGEILAFLGSNGAGKTTTIEILEGFRDRTAGDVSVLGHDPTTAPRSWREQLGIVLQTSEPDADLTVRESVEMYANYYAAPRDVEGVLQTVGLVDQSTQRTKELSGGQKRRLDLAVALIGDPRLIFLDEPTTGFDPSARRDAWGMVESLRDLGATVVLTTHYMDEAEQLADRIVVISDGLIVADGTAADLADQVELVTTVSWDAAEAPATELPHSLRALAQDDDGQVRIETDDVTSVVHSLTRWAVAEGRRIDSLAVVRPNLEDTFLRLTDGDEHPP